ncbi:MAG TPA: hypothetical protein VGM92_06660 [Candidatus Kapabacteria bacterium]|jgi:hypothetical protein
MKMLVLFVLVLLLGGCTSLVYTPYLHLPAAPMKSGTMSVAGSGEGLPETSSSTISASGEGILAYALTDNVTLRGGAWSRVSDIRSGEVDGTSLDAIVALSRPMQLKQALEMGTVPVYSGFDVAIVPRAMSLYGWNTLGLAGSISAAVWLPSIWSPEGKFAMRPYIAIGGLVGTGYTSNSNGASGHGYGMLNNLGLTMTFSPHFSINEEVANPIVWTTMTKALTWYLTPSMTVSYAW